VSYQDTDLQFRLFPDDDLCVLSNEIPPEEKARLKYVRQQSERTLVLNSQLGPYFLQSLADLAEENLVALVVRQLKNTAPGVMEGQGASNLWDEICVGLYNDSSLSEMYSDYIYRSLIDAVKKCPEPERVALWFMTYSGQIFLEELPEKLTVPHDIPVNVVDIAQNTLQSVLNETLNDHSPWVLEMLGI
jgi:hypothetical protein